MLLSVVVVSMSDCLAIMLPIPQHTGICNHNMINTIIIIIITTYKQSRQNKHKTTYIYIYIYIYIYMYYC